MEDDKNNPLLNLIAKAETSCAVWDILCQYAIANHQSESPYQNQNYAKWLIQIVKQMIWDYTRMCVFL